MLPPLVGVAVKVAFVPEQIVAVPEIVPGVGLSRSSTDLLRFLHLGDGDQPHAE